MSVILNHPINGMSATTVDPDYVVFPAAQSITIDSADDSVAIGDPNGTLATVTAQHALKVDGSAVTQPVSAASLPLPAGAATSALQSAGNSSLASIDAKLTNPLPVSGPLTDTQLRATPVPVSGTVTANAGTNLNTSLLALDSTVAKDASLTTLNTSVNTLLKPASTLTAVTTVGTITNPVTAVQATAANLNATVVGSVTANAGTNLNTSALALDSTVAKDASLTTINTSVNTLLKPASTLNKVTTVDTITNPVAATQSGTWNINNVSGTVSLPTGASTSAKQPALGTAGSASTDVITVQGIAAMTPLKTDGSGVTQPVSAASLPLPSGASTSALQTTGNTSLASIDGHLDVNLSTRLKPADTLAAVTTVGTITNPVTVAQATAANLNATVTGTVAATQSGTWNINNVSGTVSLPTGAATATNQSTANTSLASIDGKLKDDSAGSLYVNIENQKATYSAASTFTAAATATDVFTITGSGTKTVRVTKVGINGTNTGNTNVIVTGLKRSAANTGGTSSTLTNVPFDSTQAAGTATVRSYTANPASLGALVGNVRVDAAFFPTLASTNAGTDINYNFSDSTNRALVLRGTSEVFSVSLSGAVIGGTTSLSIDITWTEE